MLIHTTDDVTWVTILTVPKTVAALAGAVNESTADQLSRIVRTLVSEIDDLTSVDAAIADLADDSVQANLESMTMGSHDLTNADKVGLVGSFSSGRGIMEFVSGGLGQLLETGRDLGDTALVVAVVVVVIALGRLSEWALFGRLDREIGRRWGVEAS